MNHPTTRLFSWKTASAAARISSAVTAASRSYHSASELAAPVASSWPKRKARQGIVSVMNALAESICRPVRANSSSESESRAVGAANDDALLAELGRLGRLRKLSRRFRLERSERRRGAVEELTGRCVAGNDEVGVVRGVVPAVVRVETVARHQLDLFFASDDALPVRMA